MFFICIEYSDNTNVYDKSKEASKIYSKISEHSLDIFEIPFEVYIVWAEDIILFFRTDIVAFSMINFDLCYNNDDLSLILEYLKVEWEEIYF